MNFESLNARLDGNAIVSRETYSRLEIYVNELKRWNPKINLVAPNSLHETWERHIVDSLQIASFLPSKITNWVDVGSGGGFPGLVLAAHLCEKPEFSMTLVESDQRKCTFLRTCARLMGIKVTVLAERIEDIDVEKANIVSARALASLDKLLELTFPLSHDDTFYIFPKGKNWNNELTIAQKNWQMGVQKHQSITDKDAQILILNEVRKDAQN